MKDEIKDEIKETINILYEFATNINSDYIYDAQGFDYPLISDWIEELLDYITNLQEENKRLKELCDKYEVEHNTAFKLWTMKTEEIPTYEEKKELQNRIDKVLKSLIRKQNGFGVITSVIDEINILQGKSDE